MGGMTVQAILLNRWMLPHVGASLFGMAFVTELIYPIGLDHLWPKTSVMIMAVRTFYFSFSYGVVGLLIFLRPYGPMADITEVRLRGFQILPCTGMNGMAVITRDACGFVLAQVPEGQVSKFFMAGEAFGGLQPSLRNPFAEDKYAYPLFTAFFHVGCPGPMARLTRVFVSRAVWDLFFGVRGHGIGGVAILMTPFADLHADKAITPPNFWREKSCP
jgi:hypothetical protein